MTEAELQAIEVAYSRAIDPQSQNGDRVFFASLAREKMPALIGEIRLLRSLLDDAAGLDGAPTERLERYRRALERIVEEAPTFKVAGGTAVMKAAAVACEALEHPAAQEAFAP